jgi:hypothetical protein
MQEEIKQKDEKIEYYERKISELDTFNAKEIENLNERHRSHHSSNLHSAIMQEKEQAYKKLQVEKDQLESENKNLNSFKETKDQMERDLERLSREKEELSRNLDNLKAFTDKNNAEEARNKFDLMMREREAMKRECMNEAREELTSDQKRLIIEKEELEKNMKQQRLAVENIKNEKKKSAEENRRLRQELEICLSQVEKSVLLQNDMKKTITMLKSKIKDLENERNSAENKFQIEREALNAQFDAQMDGLRGELKNYEEQIKIRTKELKNMRGLAQMILDQRSDVEQFFLESLEQIKEEVQKRIIAEGKTKKLPMIGQKGKVYSDKVELSDLDWEDRERVLRLLFSKMNAGIPPVKWRN